MARRPTKVETLQTLLDTTDLTTEGLAERAGISRATIYNALNGREPRRTTIVRLAKALGIEPDRLRAAIAAGRKG